MGWANFRVIVDRGVYGPWALASILHRLVEKKVCSSVGICVVRGKHVDDSTSGRHLEIGSKRDLQL